MEMLPKMCLVRIQLPLLAGTELKAALPPWGLLALCKKTTSKR